MLRVAPMRLGRWKSLDFLRGRSKKMGSVHTRHTLGSRGRYKRYTVNHGLRDGVNIVTNHTRGGLGIKLGGGLFGLRIPRQQALSTMSREEYELALHGHPNITNPYRHHLHDHPALDRVTAHAHVALQLVLLLPRVPRRHASLSRQQHTDSEAQQHGDGSTRGDEREGGVPRVWWEVVREAQAALSVLFAPTTTRSSSSSAATAATEAASPQAAALLAQVHLCTLDACVCVPAQWLCCRRARTAYEADEVQRQEQQHDTDGLLERALRALYDDLARGRRVRLQRGEQHAHDKVIAGRGGSSSSDGVTLPVETTTASTDADDWSRPRLPHARFLGAPLLAPAAKATPAASAAQTGRSDVTRVQERGVAAVVRQLRLALPDALCVCLRPQTAPRHTRDGGSDGHDDENDVAALHDSSSRAARTRRPHPAVLVSSRDVDRDEAAAAASPPLRHRDVDRDEEAGVWRCRRNRLGRLVRWHYCNRDPRAHNGDALQHSARRLSIIVLADASRCTTADAAANAPRVSSLLTPRFAEELVHMGYQALPPRSLYDTLCELSAWTSQQRAAAAVAHDNEATRTARATRTTTMAAAVA